MHRGEVDCAVKVLAAISLPVTYHPLERGVVYRFPTGSSLAENRVNSASSVR